jgi:hypothetical protein
MSTESGHIEPRLGGDGGLRRLLAGRRWRIIPEIDKDPVIVAYTETLGGRVIAFACFALLLQWLGQNPLFAVLAEASGLAGRYRWRVIPLATLVVLYLKNFCISDDLVATVASQEGIADRLSIPMVMAGSLGLVLLFSVCLVKFWREISSIRFLRRPTLFLISCFMILVLTAESPVTGGALRVLLWSLTMAFLPYLWFLAYALGDIAAGHRAPASHFLGVFHPFWSNSPVPFGKSVAYLRRFEAKTPTELAVTQLKAIKLALWVVILAVLSYCLDGIFHEYLEVPQYDAVFAAFISGHSYPWHICWLSLIAFYLHDLLMMTIIGGMFISYARMAGFRLLRNTYNPLAATTIAGFWNRYFYYYKELLVDHFFYPTFFLCFRGYPRVRIFFATFVAACLGNLFSHFAMDIHFVAEMGWRRALAGEESHAFYTVLLALGIGLSQMRNRPAARSQTRLSGRLLACVGVALFFCFLHVFDAPDDREHSIWQRQQFLVHLAGLDRWI